jgi:hypothetical protein
LYSREWLESLICTANIGEMDLNNARDFKNTATINYCVHMIPLKGISVGNYTLLDMTLQTLETLN